MTAPQEAGRECPLCGATTEAAVWPFLKGVGADGEVLVWRRCNHCQALFSNHTLPPDAIRVIARRDTGIIPRCHTGEDRP